MDPKAHSHACIGFEKTLKTFSAIIMKKRPGSHWVVGTFSRTDADKGVSWLIRGETPEIPTT